MNRKLNIMMSITGIFIVLIGLLGITYGYYMTKINGNKNYASINISTSDLKLEYGENDGYLIGQREIIEPGKTFETKTFTVTNKGNEIINAYGVVIDNVSITDATTKESVGLESTREGKDNDFDLILTCKNGSVFCKDTEIVYEDVLPEENAILVVASIKPGETHTYTATLIYQETNVDQSADKNKNITGRFNIIDTKDTIDIQGEVTNYSEGDYVQTNSIKRVSLINPDNTYKIIGLETGKHKIKICSKTDINCEKPKLIETIVINKGEKPNVTGTTLTITDKSRTANVDIDAKDKINIDEEIKDYNPFKKGTLAYYIFSNGAQVLNVNKNELEVDTTYEEKTSITNISDGNDMADTGIFTIEDDYGTSYYYRGPVKNNYVNFAGFTWRIVRINGDGSVRIILDGTLDKVCADYEKDETGTCTKNAGKLSYYNYNKDNNAYIGYMYGLPLTDTENIKQNRCLKLKSSTVTDYISDYSTKESCEEFGGKWTTDSYEATHANVKNSTIKTNVDTFYETYIENTKNNKHYEKYLADTLFCNDKVPSTRIDLGSSTSLNTGLGIGKQITYYAASERLSYSTGTASIMIARPSLKCAVDATNNYSRFTSNIETTTTLQNGTVINNDLKHPIALLSADELVLAGVTNRKHNKSYYLYDSYIDGLVYDKWWIGSPHVMNSTYAGIFYSSNSTFSLTETSVNQGVRPVINLKPNIIIESGNGTKGEGAYILKEIN